MDRIYSQKKPLIEWQGQDCDPVIKNLLINRGISHDSQMDYVLSACTHFNQFKHIVLAQKTIGQAVIQQKDICIVGDYDADGATSCALMMMLLRDFGARVRFIVPNRATDGYGLSKGLIDRLHDKPDLIITVDNGVSAVDACDYAESLGIDVVITDHHLPPECLPKAAAIINPSLQDETFPDKSLSGVGVAWYVLVAVRAYLKDEGYFNNRKIPNCADYLDLVALGTVADLVPLSHLNRLLVSQGLMRMNQSPRPGIKALMFVANKTDQVIYAKDLGFALGPRLNAAGRLEDMTIGIRCLMASTLDEGLSLANMLDGLNEKRKHLEKSAIDSVISGLSNQGRDACVVYDPTWHEGVIGLVASRIKEALNVPVVAMTNNGQGIVKGSARSVKGIHIRDVLVEIDRKHEGLLISFGGHAMAAGMSIEFERLEEFKEAFIKEMHHLVIAREGSAEWVYDLSLPASYFSLQFARQLNQLTPWGQGFEEPVFHQQFELVNMQELKGGVMRFSLLLEDRVIEGIRFKSYRSHSVQIGERVDVYFTLDVNRFRGLDRLQVIVIDLAVCRVLA